jgi:hypothetical protein
VYEEDQMKEGRRTIRLVKLSRGKGIKGKFRKKQNNRVKELEDVLLVLPVCY